MTLQAAAHRLVFLAMRLGLGAIFAYAGAVKLTHSQSLADSIASLHLLPAVFINPLALALPPYEVAVGALLLTGWQRRAAAFCAAAATGVFLLALLWALARGLPVECGCFGAGQSTLPPTVRLWWDAGRDALLLGAALALYLEALFEPKPASASWGDRPGCHHQ